MACAIDACTLLLLYFIRLNLANAVPRSIGRGRSFKYSPAIVRPPFRYWLPDASDDPTIVKANIRATGVIGAGGLEFLPFHNYGGGSRGASPGLDWSRYDFGTPPFQELYRAVLEAHYENGLRMDFVLGPKQVQGVPVSLAGGGLQWDLVPFSAQVPSDENFKGAPPD